MSILLFLTLCLVVLSMVYYWQTPRRRPKVRELSSYDIIRALQHTQSKLYCGCGWLFSCRACGERMSNVDESIKGDI